MFNFTNNRRGRPWQIMLTCGRASSRSAEPKRAWVCTHLGAALLLALMAWVLPQTAAAEQFIHEPDNYSVSLGGSNIVYFTAPVYDQKNVDQWVRYGFLLVSVDGGTPKKIFMWSAQDTDIDSDATEVKNRVPIVYGRLLRHHVGQHQQLRQGNKEQIRLC